MEEEKKEEKERREGRRVKWAFGKVKILVFWFWGFRFGNGFWISVLV